MKLPMASTKVCHRSLSLGSGLLRSNCAFTLLTELFISVRIAPVSAVYTRYQKPKQTGPNFNPTITCVIAIIMPSHSLQVFYGFCEHRRNRMHNGSLWIKMRRNTRRKAILLTFITIMQAAISFMFDRRDRSVWMFLRFSTWWEDIVLGNFGP